MLDSNQKIFGVGWKDDGCKSCGGGGGGGSGPRWWQPIAIVLVITYGGRLMTLSGWLASRGTRITGSSCAWDASAGIYMVTYRVQNDEPMFKTLSVNVQGRFRPQPGQEWPHPSVQREYAATTKTVSPTLGPSQSAQQRVAFSIPGANAFSCSTRIAVGMQEKFTEQQWRVVHGR